MTQDEFYQRLAEQYFNVPPDEVEDVVEEAQERMERGSWKTLKPLLEVEND